MKGPQESSRSLIPTKAEIAFGLPNISNCEVLPRADLISVVLNCPAEKRYFSPGHSRGHERSPRG